MRHSTTTIPGHLPAETSISRSASSKAVHDGEAPLVIGLRVRDITAFEEMVKRYERPLLSVAVRITNNLEDAEEAVQDSFLRVFQHIDSFRGESLFRTWLTRITINESLIRIRRKSIKKQVSIDDDRSENWTTRPRELRASGPTPEESYSAHELEIIAQRLSSNINASSRRLMRLWTDLNLSPKEIAKVVGLKMSTVKSRLYRTRQKLRYAIRKQCVSMNPTVRIHTPLRKEQNDN